MDITAILLSLGFIYWNIEKRLIRIETEMKLQTELLDSIQSDLFHQQNSDSK